MDSLFAFSQEVYLEPAGRASREVYLRSQPRPPWLAWMAVRNGALRGHRGELAPNTEKKLGSEGPAPGPAAGTAHSAGLWAHCPERQPPSQCLHSVPVGSPCPVGADVQASAGQWHQRGPAWLVARKSHGSSRAHARCLVSHWVISWGARAGCLLSSLTPIPLSQRSPQSLLAPSRHLGRSAPCRSSQASCMLPACSPPHTGPAQPTGRLL